jgi:pimeloyl-ACP methyl ester carboxylesterase
MFWRPRLILIQGVGFDAGGWDPVLRRLRRDFRLVVLDNRGVGASDSPSGWYTVKTMVADVVAVLDAERIPAAHVLGVSLGGMVAQELAISHPERVKRLVLVSTTSGWPLTYPLPAPSRRMLATAPVLPRETALRRQITNMTSQKSILARPHLTERMSDYLRTRSHHPRSGRRQMIAGASYIGGLRQRRIRAQTLVLHGSADTVADPRNANLLAAQIPDAELVIFTDAGHLLCWEHPDRFCNVVTTFLRRSAKRRVLNAKSLIGQSPKTDHVLTRD